MKKTFSIILGAALLFSAVSCELDNYDGPDAQIYGAVYDSETGDLIEQDINNGSRIVYMELGWDNPVEQYMRFKSNGEYRNNIMFSADYDIYFNESNFVIPEKLEAYHVGKGENRLDFHVQPYIRISDVKVEKNGDKFVATFTVSPTVDDAVSKVGLFCDLDPVAGDVISLKKTVVDVNRVLTAPEEFTVEIDTKDDNNFDAGETYWFRAGAVISWNNVKYNYSHPVSLVF